MVDCAAGNDGQTELADVIAFIDEAGSGGVKLRNLKETNDREIALMCALPIPRECVDYVRQRLQPAYDRFCASAPSNAKLHITDAFASGIGDPWRVSAEAARETILAVMREIQCRVVYAARRYRVARLTYEFRAERKANAKAEMEARGPSKYAIHGLDRPINDVVFDEVMSCLTLMLDTFMEVHGKQLSDLHFDQIDQSLAERYERMIERTRNVSSSCHQVTARNRETNQNETRTLRLELQADFDLNTKRVGGIFVAGKSDPLIFAVDVVANSLLRHLQTLPSDAHLNVKSSLSGWALEPITFYDCRPNAPTPIFDLF